MESIEEMCKKAAIRAKWGTINNASKELLGVRFEDVNEVLFTMFDDTISKEMKRKRKALFLLYSAAAIADNIPFSKALELYEWAETTDEPKVEYKEYADFMGVKDIDFGSTTIRLHKREKPLECKMPYRDAALNSLNIIQEMLDEIR